MAKSPHIISKHYFDLTIENMGEAFSIQQEVSEITQGDLTDELESLFDELIPEDVFVRIDRIDIDLGQLSREEIREQLAERFIEELRNTLPSIHPELLRSRFAPHQEDGLKELESSPLDGQVTTTPEDQVIRSLKDPEIRTIDAWLYFLKYGVLPWWFTSPTDSTYFEKEIPKILQSKPEQIETFRRLVYQEIPLERLVLQFPDSFHTKILGTKLQQIQDLVKLIQEFIRFITSRSIKPISTQGSVTEIRLGWKAVYHTFAAIDQEGPASYEKTMLSATLKRLTEQHSDRVYTSTLLNDFLQTWGIKSGYWYTVITNVEKELHHKHPYDQSGSASIRDLPPQKDQAQTVDGLKPEDSSVLAEKKRTEIEIEPKSTSHAKDALDPESLHDSERPQGKMPTNEAEEHSSLTRATPIHTEGIIEEGTEIYVDHAGLVLLHPFLPAHFRSQNWVEKDRFAHEESKQYAIHQLHYLATGQQKILEYEMGMHKLLCGFPIEQPVNRFLELKETAQTEAIDLLNAVINHWDALKNSSPDSLREAFIQRPGKLTRKQTHWVVHIEKQTIDILLTKLPWGFGMIQLPWMRERLVVEWI